ncbi:hypothetical protein PPL_09952 [Heterostelium album PN500]|uniref:phosphomevalonate kinase n=1 Tax=Heterostelium pallidum (strain ATCC 26659 / Pp 5 / PN500) TaxID=670386 RepID=D3BPM7_HETP5|nr:hypothetical protein PPL_09952 [Heterostelium album PN500]EFA76647.1 hypothetical protein PPL_09952 [Heterostelium album PN500]|eukprot:XP_020428779.1 hypothetical protein PPL_09952 [Heterostelium album PN500]
MSSCEKEVCCSAPGKVLVTGGYLVLDRLFDGIVFTINSRFYTTIKPIEQQNSTVTTGNGDHHHYKLTLSSPQFKSEQQYHIVYRPNQPSVIEIQPANPTTYKENRYVEKTLFYTLIVIQSLIEQSQFIDILMQGLYITIMGANDFYSQIPQLKQRGLPISYESLKTLPQFLPLTTTLDELQKTGLGSSAALVSSLTAALLSFFKVIDLKNQSDKVKLLREKTLLHNLAQLCHCVAQGKIGSGFDISSAVFGSQVYRRFSPDLIQGILDHYDKNITPTPEQLLQSVLQEDYNSVKLDNYRKWDNEHHSMALPAGLQLLLADVSIGSNTPVMVKKVLEWRKSNPEISKQLWDDLHTSNGLVKKAFNELHQLHGSDSNSYFNTLSLLASTSQSKWLELLSKGNNDQVIKQIQLVRSSFLEIRRLLRKMGELADVPLEPVEQSNLADHTMEVLGCVASGVPGAGGFDALFSITLSDQSAQSIKEEWMKWSQCKVLPLVLSEDPTGVIQDTLPQ